MAISRSDNLSRKYIRRILPNISMVITFLLLPKKQAEQGKHLGQFGSARGRKVGQFSVGVNMPLPRLRTMALTGFCNSQDQNRAPMCASPAVTGLSLCQHALQCAKSTFKLPKRPPRPQRPRCGQRVSKDGADVMAHQSPGSHGRVATAIVLLLAALAATQTDGATSPAVPKSDSACRDQKQAADGSGTIKPVSAINSVAANAFKRWSIGLNGAFF